MAIDADSTACQLTADNARRLNVDDRLTVHNCTLEGKLAGEKLCFIDLSMLERSYIANW